MTAVLTADGSGRDSRQRADSGGDGGKTIFYPETKCRKRGVGGGGKICGTIMRD